MIQTPTESVLLVEDSNILRRRYKRELANYFEVFEAACFSDGQTLLSIIPFDLVLTDLHLSDGVKLEPEGLELIRVARKTLPQSKVFAMSTDSGQRSQAINCGADLFLEKPLSMANLYKEYKS